MNRMRDLIVIAVLLVIAGFLGHLTGEVTATRGFAAIGSLAFVAAVVALVLIPLEVLVASVRGFNEGRGEKVARPRVSAERTPESFNHEPERRRR